MTLPIEHAHYSRPEWVTPDHVMRVQFSSGVTICQRVLKKMVGLTLCGRVHAAVKLTNFKPHF